MTPDEQQSEMLRNFDRAAQALRANLRLQGGDGHARAHTERALSHTLEACIATSEIGKGRTVQQLVAELEQLDRLFVRIKRQSLQKVMKPS